MKHTFASLLIALPALFFLTSCATSPDPDAQIPGQQVIVSIKDQKMVLMKDNVPVKYYDIATSKYGVGTGRGTYKTPTGRFVVDAKIGAGAEEGTVFKACKKTKEVLPINAPGRDAIVTRVMPLRGLDSSNKNSLARGIFIHGTPEERNIGTPSSYGCVRMRSRDVVDLFDRLGKGTPVVISEDSIRHEVAIRKPMEIKKPKEEENEMHQMPASDTLIASTNSKAPTAMPGAPEATAATPAPGAVAQHVDSSTATASAIPNERTSPQMGHTSLNSRTSATAHTSHPVAAPTTPAGGYAELAAAVPAPAPAPSASPAPEAAKKKSASTASRKTESKESKKSTATASVAPSTPAARPAATQIASAAPAPAPRPRQISAEPGLGSSVSIDTAAPSLDTYSPPIATSAPTTTTTHHASVAPRRRPAATTEAGILEAEAKLINRSTVP
ncbi:hypothetical protein DB346_02155 [Verrucomicrobia bacterium LW23]|nr:hypothetical protein DB346_02155 [Verrucomicrobia bacterium LW23]